MNSFIPTIDPLPEPALWSRVLLEAPWPAVAGLIVAGLLVAVVLVRRGQAGRAVLADSALTIAAVAVVLTAYLVTTDHERIERGSAVLVAAAAAGDAAGAGALLATDARLYAEGDAALSLDRRQILGVVAGLGRAAGIEGHRITRATASVDGPNAGRSRVVVRVDIAQGGLTFSAWELGWRKDPDGVWRVTRLVALSINGRRPGASFAAEVARFGRGRSP